MEYPRYAKLPPAPSSCALPREKPSSVDDLCPEKAWMAGKREESHAENYTVAWMRSSLEE